MRKGVLQTIAEFPVFFTVSAYPREVLHFSVGDSYEDSKGRVILYAESRGSDNKWRSLAKGTVEEWRAMKPKPAHDIKKK